MPGQAVGHPRRHPPVPTAREQGAGASGISLGVRGRDDDRSAGAGDRHQRRHGDCSQMARQPLQQARLRPVRLRRLRRLRRRLPDGRGGLGGRLAGRPSRARRPVLIYDNNHITIEGKTSIAFTEDVAARFLAYRWNVLRVGDANDLQRIEDALAVFRKTEGRPTLIILDSHIGYGSPHKIDTSAAHGEPLGEDEVRLTKRAYGWPEDAKFLVPEGVMGAFDAGIGARGAEARRRWEALIADYRKQFPELAAEIDQMQQRDLPKGWDRNLPSFKPDPKGIAGRDASGEVLNVLAQNIPWFLGGSADLGSSNKTTLKFAGAGDFEPGSPGGRNFHFGIREHAMAAIVNGLSLSKLRAFGATFFIFSDYARPAIRLSALMELPSIFVFTHEAMGDGEDGPTH